jgi:F-type H+-transporting ATPase subunit b
MKTLNIKNLTIITLLLSMTTPAFAGGGDYTSQTVNFLLLVIILFVIAWKNIPRLLENRAQDIEHEIEKGQKDLEIAQTKREEVMEQLQNLDTEISKIEEQAEKDIISLKAKLDQQLADEKERIAGSTQRSIQDELNRAKYEIKQEYAELAIQTATTMLKEKITEGDHKKLSGDFAQAVTQEEKENNHV